MGDRSTSLEAAVPLINININTIFILIYYYNYNIEYLKYGGVSYATLNHLTSGPNVVKLVPLWNCNMWNVLGGLRLGGLRVTAWWILDDGLLGEHVLPSVADARARLIAPGAPIIPSAATVWAVAVDCQPAAEPLVAPFRACTTPFAEEGGGLDLTRVFGM